jgi:hypothetical protein
MELDLYRTVHAAYMRLAKAAGLPLVQESVRSDFDDDGSDYYLRPRHTTDTAAAAVATPKDPQSRGSQDRYPKELVAMLENEGTTTTVSRDAPSYKPQQQQTATSTLHRMRGNPLEYLPRLDTTGLTAEVAAIVRQLHQKVLLKVVKEAELKLMKYRLLRHSKHSHSHSHSNTVIQPTTTTATTPHNCDNKEAEDDVHANNNKDRDVFTDPGIADVTATAAAQTHQQQQ